MLCRAFPRAHLSVITTAGEGPSRAYSTVPAGLVGADHCFVFPTSNPSPWYTLRRHLPQILCATKFILEWACKNMAG